MEWDTHSVASAIYVCVSGFSGHVGGCIDSFDGVHVSLCTLKGCGSAAGVTTTACLLFGRCYDS